MDYYHDKKEEGEEEEKGITNYFHKTRDYKLTYLYLAKNISDSKTHSQDKIQ